MLVLATGVTKEFPVGRRHPWEPLRVVHAVDEIELRIEAGRSLALVGESGSGKTTLGQLIAGLSTPSRGTIRFDGTDLTAAGATVRKDVRRELQVIFQDPYSSLNPRHSVRTILARPFEVHTDLDARSIDAEVQTLLSLVGLGPVDEMMGRFPHQFSGGQRQRIVFARAIALRPRFIVADEPVSSLDMSVKAQLLTLLRRFQDELGLTYLFITHELSVVRTIASEVAVMYLGRIVERTTSAALFARPLHPYTIALLGSTPMLDPRRARQRVRTPLHGAMPSPIDPPSGCHFRTRCPYAREVCATTKPALRTLGAHDVACHFVGQPDFPSTARLEPSQRELARRTSMAYPRVDASDASGDPAGGSG